MKATDFLKRQHREIESLLERLGGEQGQRAELLFELATALRAHTTMEQELLYPRFMEANEDVVVASLSEHDEIAEALADLEREGIESEHFCDLHETLRELVLGHLELEEQELLPHIEEISSEELLAGLGAVMRTRFVELRGAEERSRVD